MRSRRDQVQAYRFLRRRVITAFVAGQPDSWDFPMRRLVPTAFGGAALAAVLIGVFAIVGVLSPGHAKGWRDGDSLIVERDSGTRYVYSQGRLHPMLNYASARLFLGQDSPTVHTVSRASLAGVQRTTVQGIVGAPDAVPRPKDLVTGPWRVCETADQRTLVIAGSGATGRRLGALDGIVVAAAANGPRYLIWHDQRLRVVDPGVLTPLGLPDPVARTVGAAWLNALPSGPDLTFPRISGRGRPGPMVAGRALRVGQLVVVRNVTETQYAVVLAAGLAPVTPLVAALIQADPGTAAAYPGQAVTEVELSPSDYTLVPRLPALAGSERYPDSPLRPAVDSGGSETLCVTLADPGSPTVSVFDHEELSDQGRPVVGAAGAVPLADRVALPAGHGALVREVPQPGVTSGTIYLITDDGVKYPIDSDDARGALGLGDVRPVGLPPGFLELLPTGPTLSRAAAATPVPPPTS